jgi:hypothetical protein
LRRRAVGRLFDSGAVPSASLPSAATATASNAVTPTPGTPDTSGGAARTTEPAPTATPVPTGSFAGATMQTARYGSTATLLKDGRVLIAGGATMDQSHGPLASAELSAEIYTR